MSQALKKMEQGHDNAVEDIMDSGDWHNLPKVEKTFLIQYFAYRDTEKALALVTQDTGWLLERKQHPKFCQILEQGMNLPVQVSLLMAKEATPRSVLVMLELMDGGKSEKVRLEAAIEIQKISGLRTNDEGEGDTQNNSWNLTINHWGKSETVAEGKVIDHNS